MSNKTNTIKQTKLEQLAEMEQALLEEEDSARCRLDHNSYFFFIVTKVRRFPSKVYSKVSKVYLSTNVSTRNLFFPVYRYFFDYFLTKNIYNFKLISIFI